MADRFPEPQTIDAGGVSLATYQIDGDPDRARPPVILVHGWPEIAYSWKNQIGAIADAGFRVVALDLKGFGRSDAPADPSAYDALSLTGDFAALLDALEIDKAIFCGHDWGGALVWAMAQLRPERVAGVIGVCTPLRQRPPAAPSLIIAKKFTPAHYIVQFQEADWPEQLFATDVDRFFRIMFRKPAPREAWAALVPKIFDLPGRFRSGPTPGDDDLIVSLDDLQVYIDAYKRSGFHGGINLYRNIDRNWAIMNDRDQTVGAPALWVGADLDLFLPPETSADMDAIVPDLEKHIVPDAGHWLMWEQPAALNALITDWLKRRFA